MADESTTNITGHPTEIYAEEFPKTGRWGLLAEFTEPEELVNAAQKAYDAGYRQMDAYSPMPVHGLSDALGFYRTWMPQIVLTFGLLGCISGFSLCYYMAVIAYPLNVGGRPLNSWPQWIPITFELTVLFAALSAVIGMIGLNGLPKPYHPVFNVPRFSLASQDRFFLCIEASDPKFDPVETRLFLEKLQPYEISNVDV
jgi:hypothetical protein